MLVDRRLELCNSTALNLGAPASYLLGDQPDLGVNLVRDVGSGYDVYLVLQVRVTCTGAGASLQVALASDPVAAMTPGTAVEAFNTPVYPVASLVAGFTRVFALPPGITYGRFLGLIQKTVGAAFTAGQISAFITMDPSILRSYPDAIN
jgi:hypothetical protein